jgi:hypothetical protein
MNHHQQQNVLAGGVRFGIHRPMDSVERAHDATCSSVDVYRGDKETASGLGIGYCLPALNLGIDQFGDPCGRGNPVELGVKLNLRDGFWLNATADGLP